MSSGDNNSSEDVTPLSVSACFDETFKKYLELMRGDEGNTGDKKGQEIITESIRKLEDLTRQVSVLGILSENENYKEMNPSELKFILLPFLLGHFWQLSKSDTRENLCRLSIVYFRDYLKRCFNYEVILKLPPGAKPDKEDDESEGTSKKARAPPKVNSDDVRAMKVQRFREAKKLDEKIALYLDSHLKGLSLDEEELRTLIISLLRRNTIEAEEQLRSMAEELELIKRAGEINIANKPGASAGPSSTCSHNRHSHAKRDTSGNPPGVYILTKTPEEKLVYGAGYPSVPVMTVDELYEHRRKTGQWGPPTSKLPPAGETEEERDAQEEVLEEQDDEQLLERRRNMDDYKDDHRRGWGNRYNRS